MATASPDACRGLPLPKVAVIVLNWNGREDTLRCLESLADVEYEPLDIIVVDNGSTDGSVPAIRARYPAVTVLETGLNLGFAGGNNVGLREALRRGADFAFILNNDATVAPSTIQALIEVAERHAAVGALSPKIYYSSDPRRIWYAGGRWSPLLNAFSHVGQGKIDNGIDYETIDETEHASGCAMLVSAKVFREIGFFDEKFFLLFEETDWCFRAREAGYRCLLVPRAIVWHRVSSSFGGSRTPLYRYFYIRNRLLWAERHLGLKHRVAVWVATVCELLPAWFAPWDAVVLLLVHLRPRQAYWEVHKWLRTFPRVWNSSERALRIAARQAVWDYLRRRFGDCPDAIRGLRTLSRQVAAREE